MITVKDTKSVSFLKLEPFRLIISLHSFCFCLARADKSVDFLLHCSCITYSFCASAFVIVSLTWLAYFLSRDYLSFLNSLGFLIFFSFFLSDEGKANAWVETLDYTIRIGSTPTVLYFDLYYQRARYVNFIPHAGLSDGYYIFLHLLCICYCFSHLIGLLSVTWLSLLYKFAWFLNFFLFLSDQRSKRPNGRNVRIYYPYWQYTDHFIFRFILSTCALC